MVPTTSLAFGTLLKQHRLAAGLTQEALAERAHLSVRAISDLERGLNHRPRKDTIQLLADALELGALERSSFEAIGSRLHGTLPSRQPQSEFLPKIEPAPADSPDFLMHSLPATPTLLIGRTQELVAVKERPSQTDVRLLTLTGAGGTGKTRLALAAADQLHDVFADGVAFVDLSPIADPAFVASAIAQTLGVREAGARPVWDLLRDYLRARNMLLVLDNFEQVLGAAHVVAELLASCSRIKLLVTSRVTLPLRWAFEYPVPTLAVPELKSGTSFEDLQSSPAVALFVERARSLKPDFILDAQNARAVADICIHLDGLPLAIELVASWIKLFPPSVLLTRLKGRLDLVNRVAEDAPDRHKTLRATIDWSYRLLSDDEQTLFRRLAIFVGGCTFDGIMAVCLSPSDKGAKIVDMVASLIDKNLLQVEAAVRGEPRFRLMETLREYGLEKLRDADEEAIVRGRHRDWCVDLANRAELGCLGPDIVGWLARLETEHDNTRSTLDWCTIGLGGVAAGLEVAGATWLFWDIRGYLQEGRDHLERLLAIPEAPLYPSRYAKALDAAGWLSFLQGDFVSARTFMERGLSEWRRVNDRSGTAWSLARSGMVAFNMGQADAAVEIFDESQSLARDCGDLPLSVWALFGLAHGIWLQGDVQGAKRLLNKCLESCRDRRNNFTWGAAWTLFSLGQLFFQEGDYARAEVTTKESLALRWAIEDRRTIADSLGALAYVATVMGSFPCAARLFGATSAIRELTGAALLPWLQQVHGQCLAAVQTALGDKSFAAAWAEGHAMPLEQAVAYALEASMSASVSTE